MLKKTISVILSACTLYAGSAVFLGNMSPYSLSAYAAQGGASDYSYSVTPLLSPFNEYFFVKTDNPDPKSFRFADKSSKYSDDSSIEFDYDDWSEEVNLYADIKYEDAETGRVNGGYIFKSFNTDGGELLLQEKDSSSYSWDLKWNDTSIKLELPELKDDIDYLIDTYADKTGFFDNMDAVQSGFSSICLYSGSYIRGELYKPGDFWSMSTSPHKDQTFYIQSPYSRKDDKILFASTIYPFRYDSLGFPSVMAEISKRLDASSSYEWSDSSHAYIEVTFGGETHIYGGQGNGDGQAISEDKITQFINPGKDKITLQSARQLLDYYSDVEMDDDVPRDGALTWEKICSSVGEGTWVRLTLIVGIFGGTATGYTYLYKKDDGTYHWADKAGDDGSEIYWGGDMGFFSDAWVDGRYIDSWERYVPGEKFDDHPTSDIMLLDVQIPQISYSYEYKYNQDTGNYEKVYNDINITQESKNALFEYSEDGWCVDSDAFNNGCANYSVITELVEKGLVDKKYLDMVTLTLDEVKALNVDKNTDTIPTKGLIFDGSAEPGTPYDVIPMNDPEIIAEISPLPLAYNGKVQTPNISIRYKGETLKENVDYELRGDTGAAEPGTYNISVVGIGKYGGSLRLSYDIKYLAGDVDFNGELSVSDAIILQKSIVGIVKLSDAEFIAADVDKDGDITVSDAILIQKRVVGIVPIDYV